MSAELFQRQRIKRFCVDNDIEVPNFASALELSRCMASCLSLLDGGPPGGGEGSGNLAALEARRNALRAEVNASAVEAARLEAEATARIDGQETLKLLALLLKIESIADAALS